MHDENQDAVNDVVVLHEQLRIFKAERHDRLSQWGRLDDRTFTKYCDSDNFEASRVRIRYALSAYDNDLGYLLRDRTRYNRRFAED